MPDKAPFPEEWCSTGTGHQAGGGFPFGISEAHLDKAVVAVILCWGQLSFESEVGPETPEVPFPSPSKTLSLNNRVMWKTRGQQSKDPLCFLDGFLLKLSSANP